jgi:hypothetical protein
MRPVLSLLAGGQPQLEPYCWGFARIGRPSPSCYAVASRHKENRPHCQDNRWLGSETAGRLSRWLKSRIAATAFRR